MNPKTPLRYPGGKSKVTKNIFRNLPRFKRYREPFLGGGSCALYISKNYSVPVWVNDKYYNLYCFWKTLQENSELLYTRVLEEKQKADSYEDTVGAHRQLFTDAREGLTQDLSVHERGILFYICNKCSFSGVSESGGFSALASKQNYTYAGIQRLRQYAPLIERWLITNYDYSDVLEDAGDDEFIFCDPPYDIKSGLYGKSGYHHLNFGHVEFSEKVSSVGSNVMITYNSSQEIRDLYRDWNVKEWDLTYTMQSSKMYSENQKKRKELLITNYEDEQEF